MKARHRLSFLFLAVPVALVGCQQAATPKPKEAVSSPAAVQPASKEKDQEADIRDALAQLSPEDRPLAEEISAWHAQASISGADFPFATAETG